MEIDRTKFEQDEYVFRLRALLANEPHVLDLTRLEDDVRQTADREGKLPTVTPATLRARLERALFWLAVFEDVRFIDRDGDEKAWLLRIRGADEPASADPGPEADSVAAEVSFSIETTSVAGSMPPFPDPDQENYRLQIRSALNGAPNRTMDKDALYSAVEASREAAGKEFVDLIHAGVLLKMRQRAEVRREGDDYELIA